MPTIEPATPTGRYVLEEWENEGGPDPQMREAILKIEGEAAAPDPVASPAPLDVERLKRAVHIVTDNEEYHLEYTSEGFRLAKDVAAEYARLAGQPVAEEPA